MIEPLEPRVLLSGDLSYAAVADGGLTVCLDPTDSGVIQVVETGTDNVVASQSLGELTGDAGYGVRIDGSGFDVDLTVDESVLGAQQLLDAGGIVFDAGAGEDSLIGADTANTWHITGTGAGDIGSDVIRFTGVENLTGGAEADTFVVSGGMVSGTLEGGAGSDTLIGPNADATWSVTGSDTGSVDGIGFGGIENLIGGSGGDTFVFGDGAGISGVLDGGLGLNKLDYTAYATEVTIDLGTGAATGTGGTAGFQDIIGGAGSDTLVGPDTDTTWFITGMDEGNVAGVEFSGVENLSGMSDNEDTFVWTPGGSLSGSIEGGAGGFDALVIRGGHYDSVTFSATGADSGTVELDGTLVTYTGLEPLDLELVDSVGTITVNANPLLADQLVLERDTSGRMRVRSLNLTMETVSFDNPTVSLTINLGDGVLGLFGTGDDVITVTELDPDFAATLIINGQGGTDQVDVTESLFLNGGSLTVNSENINVTAGVTISTRATDAGGDSIADSGAVTLDGRVIDLPAGSEILAQANNDYNSGDVLIKAEATETSFSFLPDFLERNATARIELEGVTIQGGNVTVEAIARTTKGTAETDNPFLSVLDGVGLLDFSGLFGVSRAEAIADVLIGSATTIIADADVTISASATSVSEMTALATYIGFVYTNSAATAGASVAEGATIDSGGALTVQAEATNEVSNLIKSGVTPGPDIQLAVTTVNTTSEAAIERGAVVSAGSVEVTAQSTNTINTGSAGLEVVGGASGVAVTISSLTSTADAHIDADLTTPGDVIITARSDSVALDDEGQVTGPGNITAAVVDSWALFPDSNSSIWAKIKGFLGKSENQPDPESKPSNPVDIGAAVAIANSSNIANAYVGADARIRAGNDVRISAGTKDLFQILGISAAEDANIALSAAVAVGTYHDEANAYIGERADVAASNLLEVNADTEVPSATDLSFFTEPDVFWSTLRDSWVGLLWDTESVLAGMIFTSYVRSAAEPNSSGQFGGAGGVLILNLDNSAQAYLAEDAAINDDDVYQSAEQSVAVTATNDVETLNLAGLFSFDLNPTELAGTGGKASIGGSYIEVNYLNDTQAFIEDYAQVRAEKDITVTATSTDKLYTNAVAGGKAGQFGISGAFALTHIDGETRAFIEDKAIATAGNDISVAADEHIGEMTIAGGVVTGANIGIGFTVAITEIDTDVEAFIGDRLSQDDAFVGPQDAAITGNVLANDLAQDGGALSVVDPGTIGTAEGGSVTLNADGSFTYTPPSPTFEGIDEFSYTFEDAEGRADSATAFVAVLADDGANDAPLAQVDRFAGSQGAAIAGNVLANDSDPEGDLLAVTSTDPITTALGGTVSMSADGGFTYTAPAPDFTGRDSFRYDVEDGQGESRSATALLFVGLTPGRVGAGNNVLVSAASGGPDDGPAPNQLRSYSLAAALPFGGSDDAQESDKGKFGLQVSGDVSLNRITGDTLAHVDSGVTVEAGLSLDVAALNDSEIQAIAGSAAISTDQNSIGVGGSYTENTLTTTTKAYIDDAEIPRDADGLFTAVDVSAETLGGIFSITAGASGGGKLGVAGSVSINTIDDTTEAYVKDASFDAASIDVMANDGLLDTEDPENRDPRSMFAIAGAASLGGKAGVGAGVAYNTVTKTTRAYMDGVSLASANGVAAATFSDTDIQTITASLAGTSNLSFAGTLTIDVITTTNEAYITDSTIVSATNDVALSARERMEIGSVAGSGAVSSGGPGLAGAASVITLDNVTRAYIGDHPDDEPDAAGSGVETVHAAGNVLVEADSDTGIESIAVAGSYGGNVGVGASNTTLVKTDTVEAYIGGTADVAARGAQGLELAAKSSDDITTVAVGGSGGGSAGIAGSAVVNTLTETTKAHIDSGASIDATNAAVGVDPGIAVEATDDTTLFSLAGALAGGGSAGIGAGADVGVITKVTEAWIAGGLEGEELLVDASGDVLVRADSDETITSVAANVGAGGSTGIAGSASVYVVTTTTRAFIGDGGDAGLTHVHAGGDVSLSAEGDATIILSAGSAAGGGSAGVGISNTTLVKTDTVEAYIGEYADVAARGGQGLSIAADSTENITTVAVGGAGGGSAGVAGSATVNVLSETTKAHIDPHAEIDATNTEEGVLPSVALNASDDTTIFSLAGAIGGGGAVGAGAGADVGVITKDTQAYIAHSTDVDADNNVTVEAGSYEKISSISAAIAGGGTASLMGSVGVYDLTNKTRAFIGDDPAVDPEVVGSGIATVHAGGNVLVAADDDTEFDMVAGNIGGAGVASMGASATVTVVDKTTEAFLGPNAVVTADATQAGLEDVKTGQFDVEFNDLPVMTGDPTLTFADNGAEPDTITRHSGSWIDDGFEAGQSITVSSGTVDAGPNDGVYEIASISADGRLLTLQDEAELTDEVSSSPDLDVRRSTGGDGEVVASPTSAPDSNADGEEDLTDPGLSAQRSASARTGSVKGVAVTATNKDDISTISGSGGGGGVFAVNVTASVNVMTATTRAFIGDNAQVNADMPAGETEQSVLVAAGNDYYHMGIAGAVSGAGAAAVAPGAEVTIVTNTTEAFIGDSDVRADKDISVEAMAQEDVLLITAFFAGAGAAGIAATAGVLTLDATTRAYIGSEATVEAGGNVLVSASDLTDVDMVSGALGIGGAAGAGVSVGVALIGKDTEAFIDSGATVDAKGNSDALPGVFAGAIDGAGSTADEPLSRFTRESFRGVAVQASSSENVTNIAAAAGGGFVGLAGGVTVDVIDSDTTAYIGPNAHVNTDPTDVNDGQGVNVSAVNETTILSVAGGVAVGVGALAGAVDVGIVRNDTSAYIGGNAEVKAKQDVDVNALSVKDVESIAVSGSAGGVALAASVSVFSLGSPFDPNYSDGTDSANSLSAGDDTADGYAGTQSSSAYGRVTGNMGQYGGDPSDDDPDNPDQLDSGMQAAAASVDQKGSENVDVTGQLTNDEIDPVGHTEVPAGTAAFIDSGATVTAGDDIEVRAEEEINLDMTVGGLVVGAGARGASVAVVNVSSNTDAHISGNVAAGDDIEVHAGLLEQDGEDAGIDVTSAAGQAGLVGLGAAVVVVNDASTQLAYVGDSASINQADDVTITAETDQTLKAETLQAAEAAVAAGASFTDLSADGSTHAYIGDSVEVGQQENKTVGDVFVTADSSIEVTADTYALSVGLGAGAANFAKTIVAPDIRASIGDSTIDVTGNVQLMSLSEMDSDADVFSLSVGGAAAGVSFATAEVRPVIDTYIGQGSDVAAGGSIALVSRHNYGTEGPVADRGARAQAEAPGVGAVSGSGAVPTATASADMDTYVASGAILNAGQNVSLTSLAANVSDADANAWAAGLGGFGASIANATAGGTTEARMNGSITGGVDVTITADSIADAVASAEASSGGLVAANLPLASATAAPVVAAGIGDGDGAGDRAEVSGDVTIVSKATSFAEADASGFSVGLGAVGFMEANAEIAPTVTSYLGDKSVVIAGGSIALEATQIADLTAGADSAGVAAVGATGSDAIGEIDAQVGATIGAGATAQAGADLLVEARSSNTAVADADGESIALLYAPGSVVARATLRNEVQAATSDATSGMPTQLRAVGKIGFLSVAHNVADVDARGGQGGLIGAGDATATAELLDPVTRAAVGNWTTVTDGSDPKSVLMEIIAENTVNLSAVTSQTIAGAVVGNTTRSFAKIVNSRTTAEIGEDVDIDVEQLVVRADDVSIQVEAISNADVEFAIGGQVKAVSTVDVDLHPLVHIGGTGEAAEGAATGTVIDAPGQVALLALAESVKTRTEADTSTFGVTGNLLSRADNDKTVDVQVVADPGATVQTSDLLAEASANYGEEDGYIRRARTDADTVVSVISVVVGTVCNIVGEVVCLWGLICDPEEVCEDIVETVEEVLGGDVDQEYAGTESLSNSINFNADIGVASSATPTLVVDESGRVQTLDGIAVTDGTNPVSEGDVITSDEIVVTEIQNSTAGAITMLAPRGSVTGSSTVGMFNTFERVDIINYSTKDLILGEIDVNNDQEGAPPPITIVAGFGEEEWNSDVGTNAGDTVVNIESTHPDGGDIVLLGGVLNYRGTTIIHSAGGDIVQAPDVGVETQIIELRAQSGQIGAGENGDGFNDRLRVRIPFISATFEGEMGIREAYGETGVYLEVESRTPPATDGAKAIPEIDVSHVRAGSGDVDLQIGDAAYFEVLSQTRVTLEGGTVIVGLPLSDLIDPSAVPSPVDSTSDSIDLGFRHGLGDGESATYINYSGGADIGGLQHGRSYLVDVVDADHFRLGTAFDPSTTVDSTRDLIDFGYDTSGSTPVPNLHGFRTGDRVVYDSDGDPDIGGLVSGQAYYVRFISATAFKLAATLDEATAVPFLFDPAVAVNADEIDLGAPHAFTSGQAVTYRANVTPIGGLTAGSTYYVIVTGETTVRLAATPEDATAAIPVAIALDAGASAGTVHSIGIEGVDLDGSTFTGTHGLRFDLDAAGASGDHRFATASFYLATGTDVARILTEDVALIDSIIDRAEIATDGRGLVSDVGSASGNVIVTAGEGALVDSDVILSGKLDAVAGTLTVVSESGNIYSGDPEHVLEARDIVLMATKGRIGTAGEFVRTNVGSGGIDAVADLDLFLHEISGDMRVGMIGSASRDATLTSDAGIVDADPDSASDVIATNINLTALGGSIGVPANDLDIDSSSLTVGFLTASALLGIYVGETTGALQVNEVTSSSGNIRLSVADSAASGEDLVIAEGKRISALAGSVTLQAGDDVEIAGLVEASGAVFVRGDHGNADPQGTTIEVTGSVNADSAEIYGEADDDVVSLTNVTLGTMTFVILGAGNDTVHVGSNATPTSNTQGRVNDIRARLIVEGETGKDVLVVDDSGDPAHNRGVLTGTRLTGLGMGSTDQGVVNSALGIEYHGLEILDIALGSGGDEFTIAGTHLGATILRANAGADAIHVRTMSGHTTVDAGADPDTVSVGSLAPGAGGVLDGMRGLLTLIGDGAEDELSVDDTGDTNDNDGVLTGTTLVGLGMTSPDEADLVQTVTVRAGGGTFRLVVPGLPPGSNTTDPLPFDATAEHVRVALEELWDANPGLVSPGGSVPVGAGGAMGTVGHFMQAGDPGAQQAQVGVNLPSATENLAVSKVGNVYLIRLEGELGGLAGQALGQLIADSSNLTPPAGESEAAVEVAIRTEGINYYGFEALSIGLGSGADRFSAQGTSVVTQLDTGAGDDLIYVSSGARAHALDDFAPATGDLAALHELILHGPRLDPVSGEAVRPGGTLDFLQAGLQIEAGAGHNTLSVSDRYDPDADPNVIVTGSFINGLAPVPITYAATGGDFSGQGHWTQVADVGLFGRGINLYGGAGGNTIDIQSIHGSGALSTPFGRELTTVFAGEGGDVVTAAVADDPGLLLAIRGQGGADLIDGSASGLALILIGDGERDAIAGGIAGDRIFGDGGRVHYLLPPGGTGFNLVLGGEPVGDASALVNDGIFLTPDLMHTVADAATDATDTISGNAGDDIILGGGNDDAPDDPVVETFHGNAGNDVVLGDYGRITLIAGVVRSIESTDRAHGGSDLIYGETGEDILLGGAAGDIIDGAAGDDLILGDDGRLERLARFGESTNPRFRALSGTLIYDSDGNVLVGGTPMDDPAGTPQWTDFDITLLDTPPAGESAIAGDYIAGGPDADTIFGQRGDDVVQGDGSIAGKLAGAPVMARREADGTLTLVPSAEDSSDGDDYIEGNGGADLIFGNLGQDDIIGGSSSLFTLPDPEQRPDGGDLIFGGSGLHLVRNDLGDLTDEGHARDADVILGDNGNIYRLVGVNGQDGGGFLTFNYDDYSAALRIIPRAAELVDYTPGGADFDPASHAGDNGNADEIHGGLGDDVIYGMAGNDVLFGEGQDDDLIGGYGHDWISGGTGEDGILGDDGRIFTSRNDTNDEPLYGIDGIAVGELDAEIGTPGNAQRATINVSGKLKKTVDLTPFNVSPGGETDTTYLAAGADDVIYGGWGDDFLHGGSGDDAISGAEALSQFYGAPDNSGNVLRWGQARPGEFAAYDEYDPLRKVFVDENGEFLHDGTGQAFLLNFEATEGPLDIRFDSEGRPTDGDDVIFGDLGNDWLVGGSGRDHICGGWGDDLLNADDDHDTTAGTADPTANDDPDRHPTYEDIAFGGAGRDVLIANTEGDRLVDWVGEFNTYLTPFRMSGMPTISRAPRPHLVDFLYDLSESDGADATRAVDAGTDADRNGEPLGEMGLVLQNDEGWGAQHGGPADPQPGHDTGRRDLLRAADFDDISDPAEAGFYGEDGVRQVTDGYLEIFPNEINGNAVSLLFVETILHEFLEISAVLNAARPEAGTGSNAFLMFDFENLEDFKFAGIDAVARKLVIGQRTADGWGILAATNMPVLPDTDYNAKMILDGSRVMISIDGDYLAEATFPDDGFGTAPALTDGLLGVAAKDSKARFDDVLVQAMGRPTTLDTTESFADGVGDLFTGGHSGEWEVVNGRFVGRATGTEDRALNLLDFGIDHYDQGTRFELTTLLRTESLGGIVFDAFSPSDFKFVALRVDTGEVVIGHYTDHYGWVDDAATGKDLGGGGDHELGIEFRGRRVTVSVDGVQVLSHEYNMMLADGAFGLLTGTGETSFDEVRVVTDDPALSGWIQGGHPDPETPDSETLSVGGEDSGGTIHFGMNGGSAETSTGSTTGVPDDAGVESESDAGDSTVLETGSDRPLRGRRILMQRISPVAFRDWIVALEESASETGEESQGENSRPVDLDVESGEDFAGEGDLDWIVGLSRDARRNR